MSESKKDDKVYSYNLLLQNVFSSNNRKKTHPKRITSKLNLILNILPHNLF